MSSRTKIQRTLLTTLWCMLCVCTVSGFGFNFGQVIEVGNQITQQPSISAAPNFTPSLSPLSTQSEEPTWKSASPSTIVSTKPTIVASGYPSPSPSSTPTLFQSNSPTSQPSINPSLSPSWNPTQHPSNNPSVAPNDMPSITPTVPKSSAPTLQSLEPSINPTVSKSSFPTVPSPSLHPSSWFSSEPINSSSGNTPNTLKSQIPSLMPITSKSSAPTLLSPTSLPSSSHSNLPSIIQSQLPSNTPSILSTMRPSLLSSVGPTVSLSEQPSSEWTLMNEKVSAPDKNEVLSPSRANEPSCVDEPDWIFHSLPQMGCKQLAPDPSILCASIKDAGVIYNGKNVEEACCVCGGGKHVLSPSSSPSLHPTESMLTTSYPSISSSANPTLHISYNPSETPSASSSNSPSTSQSSLPTYILSERPSITNAPSVRLTYGPSSEKSINPSISSTPSHQPESERPTKLPSDRSSHSPVSLSPTMFFPVSSTSTDYASNQPSNLTFTPSINNSTAPTLEPSIVPSTKTSMKPSSNPSRQPTMNPTRHHSSSPTLAQTMHPSQKPTLNPSRRHSLSPTLSPTEQTTAPPSKQLSEFPSYVPSAEEAERYFSHESIMVVPSLQRLLNKAEVSSFERDQLLAALDSQCDALSTVQLESVSITHQNLSMRENYLVIYFHTDGLVLQSQESDKNEMEQDVAMCLEDAYSQSQAMYNSLGVPGNLDVESKKSIPLQNRTLFVVLCAICGCLILVIALFILRMGHNDRGAQGIDINDSTHGGSVVSVTDWLSYCDEELLNDIEKANDYNIKIPKDMKDSSDAASSTSVITSSVFGTCFGGSVAENTANAQEGKLNASSRKVSNTRSPAPLPRYAQVKDSNDQRRRIEDMSPLTIGDCTSPCGIGTMMNAAVLSPLSPAVWGDQNNNPASSNEVRGRHERLASTQMMTSSTRQIASNSSGNHKNKRSGAGELNSIVEELESMLSPSPKSSGPTQQSAISSEQFQTFSDDNKPQGLSADAKNGCIQSRIGEVTSILNELETMLGPMLESVPRQTNSPKTPKQYGSSSMVAMISPKIGFESPVESSGQPPVANVGKALHRNLGADGKTFAENCGVTTLLNDMKVALSPRSQTYEDIDNRTNVSTSASSARSFQSSCASSTTYTASNISYPVTTKAESWKNSSRTRSEASKLADKSAATDRLLFTI